MHRIHRLLHALQPAEINLLEKILINKETDLLNISQDESWSQVDENNSENHRRYSDPGLIDCLTNSELIQKKESLNDLNQKFSFPRNFSLTDCSKKDDFDNFQKLNIDDNMSVSSNATTITNSTIDSFEIALALCVKHSNYVSNGSKQLLHNLFVSIAGNFFFCLKKLKNNYYILLQVLLTNYNQITHQN